MRQARLEPWPLDPGVNRSATQASTPPPLLRPLPHAPKSKVPIRPASVRFKLIFLLMAIFCEPDIVLLFTSGITKKKLLISSLEPRGLVISHAQ